MGENREQELEKEVVRLPDGRRLVLYRFPVAPPEPARPPPGPAPGRRPGET